MADAKYRVTEKAGRLRYPPDREAAAGDIVTDLPARSLGWLKARGFIEPVEPPKKRTAKQSGSKGGGDA